MWVRDARLELPAPVIGFGPVTVTLLEVDASTGARMHGGAPTSVTTFTLSPPHSGGATLPRGAGVCVPWRPRDVDASGDARVRAGGGRACVGGVVGTHAVTRCLTGVAGCVLHARGCDASALTAGGQQLFTTVGFTSHVGNESIPVAVGKSESVEEVCGVS